MKTLVVVLFVALIAVGGGALSLWRQLDASHARIGELQAQVDDLKASASRAAALPAAPPPAPVAVVATKQESTPAAGTSSATEAATRARAEAMAATMRSPENLARTQTLLRAQLPTQYPDIGKVMGLSGEEVERLFDMLARQNTQSMASIGGESAAQEFARRQQQNQQELVDFFGSKYDKWKEYNTQLPTRRQLKDLGAVLTAAGTPLSDAQSSALIPALAAVEAENTRERMSQSRQGGALGALARYTPENNQKLLDAAAPHMTPQQLDGYRQMLEREGTRQDLLLGPLIEAEKKAAAMK